MTAEDIRVMVLPTPNPLARKFVVSEDVKAEGKATFSELGQCRNLPLATKIFEKPNVVQLHFFENIITVTQNGLSDWEILQELVEETIVELMPFHDASFSVEAEKKKKNLPPELKTIDEILDRTIRPALQADGGDVDLIKLEHKILFIKFEGACGDCPSSLAGTLHALEGILRNEYDPQLDVCVV